VRDRFGAAVAAIKAELAAEITARIRPRLGQENIE
jgi:hypothetical protein